MLYGGSQAVGSWGKALTGIGTAVNAPQIVPGGLGAAMQNYASPVNRSNNLPFAPVGPTGQVAGASTANYADAYSPVNSSTIKPPTTTQSGGGGGGNNVATQQAMQTQGGGGDDLQSQLDSIYSPIQAALSGQEQTLNESFAPVPGQIQAQADLSMQNIGQQRAQGTRELGAQETAAGARKEDALTSATRLYDELQRGGQQRFGGSSSAGEAFQTLTSVEQQRRQGTIQSAFETAMQQVGALKSNLEEKFALAQKEIEIQKNEAVQTATNEFKNALQQIQSSKAMAQSDRATANINMLQDLRNKVYTINLQSLQFAQQLALNDKASKAKVDAFAQQIIQATTGGQQAGTNMGNQLANVNATKYGMGSAQTPATTQAYTGRITKPQDEFV